MTASLPIIAKTALREWSTVTLRRVFERLAGREMDADIAWKLTKVRLLALRHRRLRGESCEKSVLTQPACLPAAIACSRRT